MLIKIINGNQDSEWIKHTRQSHMELLKHPPEMVEICMRDFYPNSPDGNKTIMIKFELFDVMARRFSLDDSAQCRQDKRNLDSEPLNDDIPDETDIEQLFLAKEAKHQLRSVLMQLTPIQRSRIFAYYVKRLTFRQIADSEGVAEISIRESINAAIKKIKKSL